MDGEYYYFDGKGNRISQNLKNGWNKVGNDWYYLENGNKYLYGDSCVKIGNEFYYFDYLGKMITNNIGYVYFSDERKIYFGANGTVEKNCWKTLDGFTYYFDANGCAVTGKQLIDGEWYIFDQEGVLL